MTNPKSKNPKIVITQLRLLLTLLIPVFSQNLFASVSENIFVQCNSCNSYSDYSAIAKFEGSKHIGQNVAGTVFVSNGNKTIRKFRVAKLASEPGLPAMTIANEVSFTPGEVRIVQTANWYHDIIALFDFGGGREVPEEIATSAWDLSAATYRHTQIENHFKYNADFMDYLGGYAGSLASLAGKIINVSFSFQFSFSDGSTAEFMITGFTSTGHIQVTLISATDAAGNKIPLNKDQAKALGEVLVTTEDQFRAINQAAQRMQFAQSLVTFQARMKCTFRCDVVGNCNLSCPSK